MRAADERYFARLDEQLDAALAVAREARAQGKDPSTEVEIPVAEDMADRVENLLGIPGVADRVRELEDEYGREAAALELARDFAEGRVGDYETREGKIEGAVRTAVALLTEGVVAAPIEGIDRVELATNDDGTEFVRVFYAGPIRSAGGTAQALSVLVADYVRSLLGVDRYKPRRDEIERYAEEVALYDAETGLQYSPKPAETKFIARHCPVMLDGEPTGGEEVSGYRDLERVGTNRARGGMCLVLAEGIALKPPKIKRYTSQLEEVDWPWLDDLIEGTVSGAPASDGGQALDDQAEGAGTDDGPDGDGTDDAPEGDGTDDASGDAGLADAAGQPVDAARDDTATDTPDAPEPTAPAPEAPRALEPSGKYLRDLIAGRPVFGHPSEPGGFRLRYGRARNHGFATGGVHPATMHLVDDFLATGTQLKTERPGKAAGVVPVDSIDGPTVKLATGEVRRIDDPAEALELRNGVVAILDLGEYLVNYGEFVENNHPLAPASYVTEWWVQDMAAAGADVQALEDAADVDLDRPGAERALGWAERYDAPLHPAYTYLWHDLSVEQVRGLADAVEAGEVVERGDGRSVLQLAGDEATASALETLLVPHHQGEVIAVEGWRPLVRTLGFDDDLRRDWGDDEPTPGPGDAMALVDAVAPFDVMERAPTRIGSRMGRPEKSEVREMSPAVHALFPIGEAGGDQRDVAAAAKHADGMRDTPGEIEVEVGRRRCPACDATTYTPACPDCGAHTEPEYRCRSCETPVEPDGAGRLVCPRCEGRGTSVEHRTVDVRAAYRDALEAMGERATAFEMLKGVKGLMSATKTPEPLEKGVLRAANGVSTFKDGTVRYDMTDLPVTSIRPAEVGLTAERFRELGYETALDGEPLAYDDQLVALRAQDVILSDGAAAHLMRVADFVDDLLERFYGLEPFYEVESREDLVGELVFGLAPHTSAAVVGRVVGFTSAAVGYAHPYFHAAKRRNCDGDEDCVMLLMDGLLNFSQAYLPDRRGGRMDAPLVMSSRIDPTEIDDEAHNMDIVASYPREFYEATRRLADPGEVDLRLAADTLETDDAHAGFDHTHDTSNIALGPALSAYKTLGSMTDKLEAQLELARKLRGVDETDVAERIIEYHFLPDLLGNLRAFSRQETRCVDCGEKYRRMPLTGSCRHCGGNVTLTVHEGSVSKYLETAIDVAERYGAREYTKQRLRLLERTIESVFENDRDKQTGIADFM